MRPPEPVRQHPNATFVLASAGPAALIAWLVSLAGVQMPQAAAAGAAVVLSAAGLVFANAIKRCGGAVWEFGVIGCCRRVWKGKT